MIVMDGIKFTINGKLTMDFNGKEAMLGLNT